MTIEYISKNFNKWTDIVNNEELVGKLENFLTKKRLIIAIAIANKQLTHSRDIQLIRNNKKNKYCSINDTNNSNNNNKKIMIK